MSPFLKGFSIALVSQTGLLAVIAIAFFSGGPAANPIRGMIAFLGIALTRELQKLGIEDIRQMILLLISVILVLSVVSGFICKILAKEDKGEGL
jgi:hypothetical protein